MSPLAQRVREGFGFPHWGSVPTSWRDASISVRYAIVAGLIMLVGMVIVGEWVAQRVEVGVIDNHAADAALYTDSIIAPHLQELRFSDSLTPEKKERISALLAGFFNRSMVGFRIWKGDTIVHAERSDLVGQSMPPTPLRSSALQGAVVSEYRIGGTNWFSPRVEPGQRLLEIYAPVRRAGSTEIIALMETYEIAPSLESEVRKARLGSWLLIGLIGVLMQLLQIVTVHGASRVIERQKRSLAQRVETLSRMLAENNQLRIRNQAGERVAENNERFLRKIGADLHDGPLQILGMAMLRLDGLRSSASREQFLSPDDVEEFEFVCECLAETAKEIRDIAAGLSLPQIDTQSLEKIIAIAKQRHERLSGYPVALDIQGPLPDVTPSLKVCCYRLVQEGLSNVLRHADGKGQRVSVRFEGNTLHLSVLDRGPGPLPARCTDDGLPQGIDGLRDRVEALGGQLALARRTGGGAELSATFKLESSRRATS